MSSLAVALTGNPNTGKSTIFNELTGARQKIGNWPGVTVDKKIGYLSHQGRNISVVDLPGTYSVTVSATGGASGKAKSSTTREITIAPLPAWGVGSFSGCTEQSDDDFGTTHYGLVTLSTTAAGKISGKIAIAGKNWTFSDTALYTDTWELLFRASALR